MEGMIGAGMGNESQRFRSKAWLSLIAVLGIATIQDTQAGAVTFGTSATGIAVGDTIEFRFHISGLTPAPLNSLSAFDFSVAYDTGPISFVGFDFTDSVSGLNQLDLPEVGSLGFLGDVSVVSPGNLTVFGLSPNSSSVLDIGQAGEFDFLRLRFRADAIAGGVSLSFDPSSSTAPFLNSQSDLLAYTVGNSNVTFDIFAGGANPASLPGSAPLAGLALGLVIWSRRRQSARAMGSLAGLCLAGFCAGAQGPVLAAGSERPASVPRAEAAAPVPQGVVEEVVGQRIRVRGADGKSRWFTATQPVPPQVVNKRVKAVTREAGDSVVLDQLSFE